MGRQSHAQVWQTGLSAARWEKIKIREPRWEARNCKKFRLSSLWQRLSPATDAGGPPQRPRAPVCRLALRRWPGFRLPAGGAVSVPGAWWAQPWRLSRETQWLQPGLSSSPHLCGQSHLPPCHLAETLLLPENELSPVPECHLEPCGLGLAPPGSQWLRTVTERRLAPSPLRVCLVPSAPRLVRLLWAKEREGRESRNRRPLHFIFLNSGSLVCCHNLAFTFHQNVSFPGRPIRSFPKIEVEGAVGSCNLYISPIQAESDFT